MPKKKEGIVEEKEVKSSKTFKVYDSNGKLVREVADEDKAKEIAKVLNGKVK